MSSRIFTNSTHYVQQLITNRNATFAKHKTVLDYVLERSTDDERPYVAIEILGHKFLGLLDSGANRTIIGGPGWDILVSLGLVPDKKLNPSCSIADGSSLSTLGTLTLPLRLRDKIAVINVLVVPDVAHALILGIDFWKSIGIVPDIFRGEFTFAPTATVTAIQTDPALLSKDDLTLEQRAALTNLISTYVSDDNKIGVAKGIEHTITTNAAPIKQRYYPVSPVIQKHIDAELDKMLELGIVEKSNSAWSSPILLIKKKDNSYRFCVDFRKVNQVTEKDAYPLPYVSSILDRLRGATFITSLDIKSAYWQIPLAESAKQYSAFTVPNRGLFHFNRMPFGLHNAPATWQRFIDKTLGSELEPYVFVYLDDIVICTPTFEQHLTILEEVLKRLRDAGLTLGKEKCHFCKPELKYLGYVVNSRGLLVDPDKVAAILRIPTPKNVPEVRRVIGMASWYRRFIPNFSTLIYIYIPLC